MNSKSIKCPGCGGDKTILTGVNHYVCQDCGASFEYTSNINTPLPPPPPTVTTCRFCGGEIPIGAQKCRHCGEWQTSSTMQSQFYQQNPTTQQPFSSTSKVAAAILAIIFGEFGIHEFYLGKPVAGIIFLLLWIFFFWTVFIPIILAIIGFIQGICYLCMSDQQFANNYH